MTSPIEPIWAGLNLAFLPTDFPGRDQLDFGPDWVAGPGGGRACLEVGPKGAVGLSHRLAGRSVRLTSVIDPAGEDRTLVKRADLSPGRGVMCYGLGLGHYLEELAESLESDDPVWVLEARPELAAAALLSRDLSAVMNRPGFRLFVGPFDGKRPWAENENPPARVLWRPATARYFAAEYPPAERSQAALRPRNSRRRVLIFQNNYYLDRELREAAEALDFETAVWFFKRGPTASGDNYQELLGLIKSFRPDLVLTVNHLGFDDQGLMDDMFSRLKLPVASWFVDSPVFILGSSQPSPQVSAFSWDSDYLDMLKVQGFSRVHYLPLASDEKIFRPAGNVRLSRAVAFVGDSLTAATGKYLAKLGLRTDAAISSGFLGAVDRLAEDFLSRADLLPAEPDLRKLAADYDLSAGTTEIVNLAALTTWRASRLWRLKVLSALPAPCLSVAGDDNWGRLLPLKPGNMLPAVDYYRQLASFYQGSRVNLNVTSAQMKTGLNQRVFDVPAAGAFLLTDRREQLFDLFEPDQEVVTYSEPDEAHCLAIWYAENPSARHKVAEAAHQRVMGCHLYRHRLARLWDLVMASS